VIFERLDIAGAYSLTQERRTDDRGYFARTWCREELARHGLVDRIAQINTGFSPKAGTLRGLHWQEPPHAEVKIVSCTRGAAFDVLVDLRRGSPTYRQWVGFELTPDNGRILYCPEGCAHGYLTLHDDTEVSYLTSMSYAAGAARGVRFDDPAFAIDWPAPIHLVSQADRHWPDFGDASAVVLPGAGA